MPDLFLAIPEAHSHLDLPTVILVFQTHFPWTLSEFEEVLALITQKTLTLIVILFVCFVFPNEIFFLIIGVMLIKIQIFEWQTPPTSVSQSPHWETQICGPQARSVCSNTYFTCAEFRF